jgi:hypothetical protein
VCGFPLLFGFWLRVNAAAAVHYAAQSTITMIYFWKSE